MYPLLLSFVPCCLLYACIVPSSRYLVKLDYLYCEASASINSFSSTSISNVWSPIVTLRIVLPTGLACVWSSVSTVAFSIVIIVVILCSLLLCMLSLYLYYTPLPSFPHPYPPSYPPGLFVLYCLPSLLYQKPGGFRHNGRPLKIMYYLIPPRQVPLSPSLFKNRPISQLFCRHIVH